MNNDDWVIAETAGKIFTGGCHCGAVRFRVTGPIGKILVCHCSDCRRMAGMSWGPAGLTKTVLNGSAMIVWRAMPVPAMPSAVIAVIVALLYFTACMRGILSASPRARSMNQMIFN